MRAKTIVTSGIMLYLNGKPFGRATSFGWESDTSRSPKYGIDSMAPFELAPTVSRASGRIGVIRTIGDSGAEGAGMTTTFYFVPREKYFSLQLIEIASDTVVFEAGYCSVAHQSWSAPSRGKVEGEIHFEALDWNNELKSTTR